METTFASCNDMKNMWFIFSLFKIENDCIAFNSTTWSYVVEYSKLQIVEFHVISIQKILLDIWPQYFPTVFPPHQLLQNETLEIAHYLIALTTSHPLICLAWFIIHKCCWARIIYDLLTTKSGKMMAQKRRARIRAERDRLHMFGFHFRARKCIIIIERRRAS